MIPFLFTLPGIDPRILCSGMEKAPRVKPRGGELHEVSNKAEGSIPTFTGMAV